MIEERSRLERRGAGGPTLVCAFVTMLMGCTGADSTSASLPPDAATDAPGGVDAGLPLDEAVEAESRPDGAADVSGLIDTELSLDGSAEARRQPDAGACWYDLSEIGQLVEPWHSIAVTGCSPSNSVTTHHSCDAGGIYYHQCGQREVLTQGPQPIQCFYEAGILVGMVLTSDIGVGSLVCNGRANFVEIGDTAGCPGLGVNLCHAQDAGVVDTSGL
jgi:hypothetical protein